MLLVTDGDNSEWQQKMVISVLKIAWDIRSQKAWLKLWNKYYYVVIKTTLVIMIIVLIISWL